MRVQLNLSLTDELRDFIDSQVGNNSNYANHSEYLQDLIRKEMEQQATFSHIVVGLQDVKHGRFSAKSIIHILDEDD